jgi:hypothetical protein
VEGRIKRNIYILIGVTILLLGGMIAAWYFALIKPIKERTERTVKSYDEEAAVANTLQQKLDDLKKAEDRKVYLEGQLAYFRLRYRNLRFGDIGTDPANLTEAQKGARIAVWRAQLNEFYSGYNDALRRTLVSVANETGVDINIPPPKVDAPPKAPEDVVIPATGFFRPTSNTNNGALNTTVTGSLSEIMRFFNRINYSPVLMVIGAIKLEDASAGGTNAGQGGSSGAPTPALTTADGQNQIRATFSVTPYLLAAGEGVKLGAGTAPAAGAPTTAPQGSSPSSD